MEKDELLNLNMFSLLKSVQSPFQKSNDKTNQFQKLAETMETKQTIKIKGQKTVLQKSISKKKISLLNLITIDNEDQKAKQLQVKKNSDLFSTLDDNTPDFENLLKSIQKQKIEESASQIDDIAVADKHTANQSNFIVLEDQLQQKTQSTKRINNNENHSSYNNYNNQSLQIVNDDKNQVQPPGSSTE